MKTSHFSINGIVDARSHKRLLNKGKLLAAALPIGLAFASPAAFADAANGVTTGTVFINSTAFQEISRVAFVVPANTTLRCVGVAGADAVNPLDGRVDHQYTFGLALNSNSPLAGSQRTIDMDDTNLADDEDRVEVTTSRFINVVNTTADPIASNIRFVAKKRAVDDPNLTLLQTSLSVKCFDNLLPDQNKLTIGDVTVTEPTSGTVEAVFNVTLSRVNDGEVRVDFQTADGTAKAADGDYVAVSQPQPLVFPGGSLSPQTNPITITVNSDSVDEQNEAFFVNLLNPANAVIEDAQGKGIITTPSDPLPPPPDPCPRPPCIDPEQ